MTRRNHTPFCLVPLLFAALLLTGLFASCRTASPDASSSYEETLPSEPETAPLPPESPAVIVPSLPEETLPDPGETLSPDPPLEPTQEAPADVPAADDDSLFLRALARKNQEYEAGSGEITRVFTDAHPEKEFTLMIYMTGSNLESALGAASADILEMENSGLSFENVNLLLYTGGSSRWQSSVPSDANAVLDMSLPRAERVAAKTAKNADMGAPETLTAFLRFCTAHYPAKNYGLIFWDHGGGPLWGYGSDELFGGDGLLLYEMKTAMAATPFAGTKKLAFVGFDACLMGNLETMTVWQDYARYFIASEETEPGDGWDYRFLSILNGTTDPVAVGNAVIDSYAAYYEAKKNDYYDPDATLSLTDLSALPSLQYALGSLSQKLEASLSRGSFAALSSARLSAKSFGNIGRADNGTEFRYDLVDLESLLDQVSSEAPREADAVRSRLDAAVVRNYSNVEGAGGLTLYYPAGNHSQFNDMRETYFALGQNLSYQSYLRQLSRRWQTAGKNSWKIAAPEKEGDAYVIRLTEDQRQTIVSASFDILAETSPGAFVSIRSGVSLEADKEGVLRLPEDPSLICLTAGEETVLWPVRETETNSRRRICETVNTRLCSSGIDYYERLISDAVGITAVLQEDRASGLFTLKTVNSVSQEVASVGRESVSVEHYDGIFFYATPRIPVWGDDGELLPFSDWKDGDSVLSSFHVLPDAFRFVSVSASEVPDDLYYVVTLEDASGTRYVSGLTKIGPEKAFGTVTEETPSGALEYAVYDDHAELVKYTGYDRLLSLPADVAGVPLTVIGSNAFYRPAQGAASRSYPLAEVVLPEGVTAIGAGAFHGCTQLVRADLPSTLRRIGSAAFMNCPALSSLVLPDGCEALGGYALAGCSSLTEIALPASLQTVGKGAFALCRSLGEIRLAEGSPFLLLEDGALYDAGGTHLIAVPQAREDSFAVREGTQVIGADAFSGSRLTQVTLPEGLVTIENYAFSETDSLLVPAFPDSLAVIGKYAFAAGWYSIRAEEQTRGEQVITLGPAVSYLGTEAFTGFPERSFTVHPDNPFFSEREGALLNGSGDALVEFASNLQRSFIVPEGVCDLDMALMEQIGTLDRADDALPCRLYLPDSLTRVSGKSIFYDDLVIHCAEGSYGESFADREGIAVSYDREPVREEFTETTDAGTFGWQLTDSHAVWVSYAGSTRNLTVPETVRGLPVTAVGTGLDSLTAASGSSLHKVVLPQTVEIISARAFQNNQQLTLTLPDSVRVIGDEAFCRCFVPFTALPPHLETLGASALGYGCRFTDGVTIPSSIRWIAPGAFSGTAVPEFRLEGPSADYDVRDGMLFATEYSILLAGTLPGADGLIRIPEGTFAVGTLAFQGIPLTALEIPSSVRIIASEAFSYCTELTEVRFGEGLEDIGSYAFLLTGIKGPLDLPSSVTRIGPFAFYGCAELSSLSTSAESIETYAFAQCSGLAEVTLREGVKDLGPGAFYNTGFSSCSLPDSLCSVGLRAFGYGEGELRPGEAFELAVGPGLTQALDGFSGLPVTAFRVSEDNPALAGTGGFLTDRTGRTLIQCPPALSGAVTVPEGIYEIGTYAFYDCPLVTDIYVPDTVTVVRDMALNDHASDGGQRIVLHLSAASPLLPYVLENNWPYVIEGPAQDSSR